MPTFRFLLFASICWLGLLPGVQPGLTAQDRPSVEEIRDRIEAIQKGTESSTLKAESIRLYEKALESLKQAQAYTGQAAAFNRDLRGAGDREKALDKEIAAGPQVLEVKAAEGASVESLRRDTNAAEARRADLEKTLGSYESLKDATSERLQAIGKRLPEVKTLIQDASRGLAKREGTRTIVEKASRVAALCELEMLRREQEELIAEQGALESRLELLPKDRRAVQVRLESARAFEKAWQNLTRKAIEAEAKKSSEKAAKLSRQAIVERFADLREIAALNVKWPRERERLASEVEEFREELKVVSNRRNRLQRRFRSLHRMIGDVGLNNSTVDLIRKETEALPEIRKLRQRQKFVQQRVAEILLEEYNVERVLETGHTQKQRIQALIQRHEKDVRGLDALLLPAIAQNLITQQDDVAGRLGIDLANMRERLWDMDRELSLLITTTAEFGDYLEERILWVPSIPSERLINLGGFGEAAAWVFSPNQWGEALSTAWTQFVHDWGVYLWPFLLCLIIVLLTPRLGRRLVAVGKKVNQPREDRYRLTWEALILTIVLGLPLPLLAWGMKALLHAAAEKGSFGEAVAASLDHLSTILLMISITIQALRPGGLCHIHFRWPADGVAQLQVTVRRFLWLVIPLFLFSGILNVSGRQEWKDSLGRVIFVLGAGLYSLLLFRASRPWGKLLEPYLTRNKDRWFSKNAYIWYVAVSGTPIFFIVLASLGYYLTARRLAQSFHQSLWAFVLVLVAFSLAQRWVRLSVKKAGIRAADRRKAELAALEEAGEVPELEESDFARLDLEAVRSKTSQLFRALAIVAFLISSFSIWANVMPALKMFDRVQLLPTPAILELPMDEGPSVSASKSPARSTATGENQKPKSPSTMTPMPMPSTESQADTVGTKGLPSLTLSQLLIFLISLGFTILGVRNLPTLVDIVLLRRLRLD